VYDQAKEEVDAVQPREHSLSPPEKVGALSDYALLALCHPTPKRIDIDA
jgi:hypothetical protein